MEQMNAVVVVIFFGSVCSLLEGITVSSNKKNGELLVKTPFMFEKYIFPKGENLDDNYSAGMETGDLGYLKDGSLFISGRVKPFSKNSPGVVVTMLGWLPKREYHSCMKGLAPS